ncbi:hypothetical protein CFN79_05520 [Chromobacterium vaccinii]|uniref:hypothetical protein n=1 Tax=Chromobacterium vaccinii TaxID=1108595 RepID=UPI000CE954F1|nr:hypothetical protein [Chromobacterium vaccinii]AVG15363.1 hypothetical protein CFN79_05520 [Chromobacterium vaccinii]
MINLERRLQAQITAQNLIIEALLDAVVKSGQLDPRELVTRLEQYVAAPKAVVADPEAVSAVTEEVDAWADMISGRYLEVTDNSPERSLR